MDEEYYNIGDETFALPSGFTFKPACGTKNSDGSVTVSGHHFTQQEIQESSEWRDIVDILKAIKEAAGDDFAKTVQSEELYPS